MKYPNKLHAINTLQYGFNMLLGIVLFVEGASLMAVELMGAKLLAPFYGSSLFVWTTVLALSAFGLFPYFYILGNIKSWICSAVNQYNKKTCLNLDVGHTSLQFYKLKMTKPVLT